MHTSFVVQMLPSSQAVPTFFGVDTSHKPVAPQVLVVHWLPSSHTVPILLGVNNFTLKRINTIERSLETLEKSTAYMISSPALMVLLDHSIYGDKEFSDLALESSNEFRDVAKLVKAKTEDIIKDFEKIIQRNLAEQKDGLLEASNKFIEKKEMYIRESAKTKLKFTFHNYTISQNG